jgi:hypothetical protein
MISRAVSAIIIYLAVKEVAFISAPREQTLVIGYLLLKPE